MPGHQLQSAARAPAACVRACQCEHMQYHEGGLSRPIHARNRPPRRAHVLAPHTFSPPNAPTCAPRFAARKGRPVARSRNAPGGRLPSDTNLGPGWVRSGPGAAPSDCLAPRTRSGTPNASRPRTHNERAATCAKHGAQNLRASMHDWPCVLKRKESAVSSRGQT